MGKPVLMGRVTWESLPFPLPGRPNLVLTRNPDYAAPKAEVFTNLNDMVGRGFELAGLLGVDEVMVIGGARLYQTLLPHCNRVYVTEVQAEIDGDALFPDLDENVWKVQCSQAIEKSPKDDYAINVDIYERIDE